MTMTHTDTGQFPAPTETQVHKTPSVLRRIVSTPKGAIGLGLVVAYAVLALIGPWIAPLDPYKQDFMATLQPPSAAHWFGTDQLGRDVFSRILVGTRISLGVGVGGVAVAFVIGVPIGLAAAWFRGIFDQVLMRFMDVMLSFPDIVFALAIVAVLGPSTQNVILAVGIISVPVFAFAARAVALSALAEPFVDGSVALGCKPSRIMVRHVLPNISGVLLTLASVLFASTLLSASGLGFLGLGTQPPEPEWGAMLGEARSYIRTHPYLATFPGLFLAVAALAFNLLGEELRSIYDPASNRIRRRSWIRKKRAAPAPDAHQSVEPGVASGRDLEISYNIAGKLEPAVRDVTLAMRPGRTLAVVGESGSGKSTLLRAFATLLPAGQAQVTKGALRIQGTDVLSTGPDNIRKLRRNNLGIVFQDASSALNPTMTVGAQLREAILSGGRFTKTEANRKALDLLREVQIPDPERRLEQYPHQFSGGMKQRVVIAIALAQEPQILLADEPTSALDVTVQQQIFTLLRERQCEREMAMLFVTHDLGLVARYADDVAVMYAGRIVEAGTVEEVFGAPRHPYTRSLQLSSPKIGVRDHRLPTIEGEPPLIGRLPDGCAFEPRCARSCGRMLCRTQVPPLRTVAGREVACHFAEEEGAA